jgi:NADPH:quinone reductase-like Zn-dependent oxidoreductase
VRAAVIAGGALRVEERPDPVPAADELLVRVRASGINGADVMQRAGRYPAPPGAPQDVPGLEFAGEDVATGERVMALVAGGGHAELAVVHRDHALPVPEAVEWDAAGGFMEAYATAHDAIVTQAGLRGGDRLLVNGAAGGVGVAAVQLAVASGAAVTGTVRHDEHRGRLHDLGAATEPEGEYDVILELVGGPNLARDLELLAPRGRLVVIGVGAGATAELDFRTLMRKRGRISASTLRARSVEDKAAVVARLRDEVLPLLAAGEVSVPVHATFPLDDAHAAYDAFAAGGKFGKLVLRMGA